MSWRGAGGGHTGGRQGLVKVTRQMGPNDMSFLLRNPSLGLLRWVALYNENLGGSGYLGISSLIPPPSGVKLFSAVSGSPVA